jgi:hypothetical protein
MYAFAKIILIILAFFAFFEGISAYSQAKSAFHQIYAAVWFAVFAISFGASGIISALTREAEAMAELKSFLQRIKNKATPKQATAGDSDKVAETVSKSAPKRSEVHPESENERKTNRQCPYCGAENPLEAKSCQTCTRILNRYIPCPKCKTDISHKPAECPGCGGRITWGATPDSTK